MPERLPNFLESPYYNILVPWLLVAHAADGTIKSSSVKIGTGDATVPDGQNAFGVVYNGVLSTPAVNGNAYGWVSALNFTKSASGTHPVVIGSELDFPHISGSGATITTIAAVRIGADNVPPYASATNVYGLHVVNGIVLLQGGDTASQTRPALRIANNQYIVFQGSGGGTTHKGHITLDASDNLILGTNDTTRLTIATGGDITLSGSLNVGVNLSFAAANPRILAGSSNLLFFDSGNATLLFQIAGNGHVGVGGVTNDTWFLTPASTTASSSIRLPHGSAPSSPIDGDMWTTTAGLFVRINGVTKSVNLT